MDNGNSCVLSLQRRIHQRKTKMGFTNKVYHSLCTILALVAKLQRETVEPTFVTTLYYRVLNLLHKVRFYRHIVDLLLQENRTCHRDDVELSNIAIKYAKALSKV